MATTEKALLAKSFGRHETWTKDEILDVVFWVRQILSVVIGLACGIVPLTGWVAFVTYLAASSAILFFYYKSYLNVDHEEFGGAWELQKEGFMSAFAIFVFVWVLAYSTLHF